MSVTLEGSSCGLQKKHRCGSLSWKHHWFILKSAFWTLTHIYVVPLIYCSATLQSFCYTDKKNLCCHILSFSAPWDTVKRKMNPRGHFHTYHNGGRTWCLISSSRWWTALTVTVRTIKINLCDEGRKAFESQSIQTHVYKVSHTNSWHWWNPSLPWGGLQCLCPSLFLQSPHLNLITSILIQNDCPGS